MEQEIRFCTSPDGTRIAYATYGEPAARALVLLRSFETAQESAWNSPGTPALYEGLASGRRLVTFDRRGVGSSQRDVDDLAIPAQVDDVGAVVDQLGLESFDLMGMAHAAALAAAYAVEHPERVGRLLLRHPLMRTSGPPLRGLQDMAQSVRANWSFARRSWAAITFPNGPAELQRGFSNMLRDSLTPEVAVRHLEAIAEFDGSAILGNVQAPTLVLAFSGRHALEIATVRAVASLIPDARLVTLQGDWGTLAVDPSQLLAAIRNFLDETDIESAATLPSGMTAILFLDIVDSTTLTTNLGDAAYREQERGLDTSLRAAITEAGGRPVEGKVLGDGVMAVFTSARQAIDAAQRCRDLGNDAGLPLHLGIHAGDVVREGNNVHGGAVQVASRVQSAAAPGEILVSDIVRGLARTSADVQFDDRGEHELKGIPEPQRLFAVREREEGGEPTAVPRVMKAGTRPAVVAARLTKDSGHEIEIVNRGSANAWDIELWNHEVRPAGTDQCRVGQCAALAPGERAEVFLRDGPHEYRGDKPGYWVWIRWTTESDTRPRTACFFAPERKRGAELTRVEDGE